MLKLPIKNPTMRVVASKELKKTITGLLGKETSMPAGVLAMCNQLAGKGEKAGAKKVLIEVGQQFDKAVELTEGEQRLLQQIAEETATETTEDAMDQARQIPNETTTATNVKETTLNIADIKWLHEKLLQLRKNDPTVPYLHELLQNCPIVLPENEMQERNPELEARCQRLRKEQEDREYLQMTKNVDNVRKHMPEETIAFQMKQINRHLIAVAQFIFSVAAGFAFGFIGIELLIGSLDFGFRLLLGIMIALTIALAEIYFLAKKLNEEYELPPESGRASSNAGKIAKPIAMTHQQSNKVHKD